MTVPMGGMNPNMGMQNQGMQANYNMALPNPNMPNQGVQVGPYGPDSSIGQMVGQTNSLMATVLRDPQTGEGVMEWANRLKARNDARVAAKGGEVAPQAMHPVAPQAMQPAVQAPSDGMGQLVAATGGTPTQVDMGQVLQMLAMMTQSLTQMVAQLMMTNGHNAQGQGQGGGQVVPQPQIQIV